MIVQHFKTAYRYWKEDHASYLAAALSYYATFSLAPLLVILMAIVGILYQQPNSRLQLLRVLQDILGANLTSIFAGSLDKGLTPSSGPLALFLGASLAILGSIGIFKQLEQGLNFIWHVESPKRSIPDLLKHYGGLFLLIIIGSVFLIASMVASALLSTAQQFLSETNIFVQTLIRIINTSISFGFTGLLFAVLLKEIPNVPLRFRQVLPAAFITAILFSVGKFAMGFYVAHSSTTSVYGAAGSLAALLIWLFYASQIFFFGAELIKAANPHLLPTKGTPSDRTTMKKPTSPVVNTISFIALYAFFKKMGKK